MPFFHGSVTPLFLGLTPLKIFKGVILSEVPCAKSKDLFTSPFDSALKKGSTQGEWGGEIIRPLN